MLAPASDLFVNDHRACIAVVAAVNLTRAPAESRLRFHTSGRTTPSARAGSRSYGDLTSRKPSPSTVNFLASCQSSSGGATEFWASSGALPSESRKWRRFIGSNQSIEIAARRYTVKRYE